MSFDADTLSPSLDSRESASTLPLRDLFSGYLRRFPEEYKKGRTLSNPYIRDLYNRIRSILGPVALHYGLDLKAIAGDGNITKDIQYIAFLKRPHEVSKGFYPIYLLRFDRGTVELGLGTSNKHPVPKELVSPIQHVASKALPEFPGVSNQGLPTKTYDLTTISDTQLTSDLHKLLEVYLTCLNATASEWPAYFESIATSSRGGDTSGSKSSLGNVWFLHAGRGGERASDFIRDGTIGIGFGLPEDLSPLDSLSSVKQSLIKAVGQEQATPEKVQACFAFAHEMQVGDIVFLKAGRKDLSAVGVVTSEYSLSEEDDLHHRRSVEWVATGPWVLGDGASQFPIKTLTDISADSSRLTQLRALSGWETYAQRLEEIIARIRLAAPFSEIFADRVEADAAFVLLSDVAQALGVKDPNDERIALTLPKKESALNLNLGSRIMVRFQREDETRVLVLAKHPLPTGAVEGLTFQEGGEDTDTTIVSLPFQSFLAEKDAWMARTLPIWREQAATHTRKANTRKLHQPLIARAVLHPELRPPLLAFGLAQAEARVTNLSSELPLSMNTPLEPLNRIYFGPPGTGKTYTLQTSEIPKYEDHLEAEPREEYLRRQLGNLAWWEVVALALADLGRAAVPVLSQHEYIRAKLSLSTTQHLRQRIWGTLQMHTPLDCDNVRFARREEPFLFWKHAESQWELRVDTFKKECPELVELAEALKTPQMGPNKTQRFAFVTFHQAFSYEDFIEGIKPVVDLEENGLKYELKKGVFLELCDRARAHPDQHFALFIDEINRGNIANIFGELITLIEDDKRDVVHATLPYSKRDFSVPRNLSIIGTMNTADRSIEALDTALRRRFSFREMAPSSDVLRSVGASCPGVDIVRLFETINSRLEALLDRDHLIGHAYFVPLGPSGTLQQLQAIFADRILPLLQEYFFGDLGRVGLVLGSKFVRPKIAGIRFASFDHADRELLEERATYEFAYPSDLTAADFASIYEG